VVHEQGGVHALPLLAPVEVLVREHCFFFNANHIVHPDFDLADLAVVADALVPLTDITHVFYAASYPRSGATEDEDRESNYDML